MADPDQEDLQVETLSGLTAENQRLTKENAELKRQLAKLPPVGPAAGTPICFRRGTETVCRRGKLVSDGYVDSIPVPGGVRLHALIEYGEPVGAPERRGLVGGVEKVIEHAFQTNRPHDPLGGPDTWHLPAECPFGRYPSLCPFSQADGTAPEAP